MCWIFGVKFVDLGDSYTVGRDPAMNIIIARVPVLNAPEQLCVSLPKLLVLEHLLISIKNAFLYHTSNHLVRPTSVKTLCFYWPYLSTLPS